MSKIFKSKFPGNRIKLLVCTDSAWFTESVPIIRNKKRINKKVIGILKPGIKPGYKQAYYPIA